MSTDLKPTCDGICFTEYELGVGHRAEIAYPHPDCPRHGLPATPVPVPHEETPR